jgi:hypothetical protein
VGTAAAASPLQRDKSKLTLKPITEFKLGKCEYSSKPLKLDNVALSAIERAMEKAVKRG